MAKEEEEEAGDSPLPLLRAEPQEAAQAAGRPTQRGARKSMVGSLLLMTLSPGLRIGSLSCRSLRCTVHEREAAALTVSVIGRDGS